MVVAPQLLAAPFSTQLSVFALPCQTFQRLCGICSRSAGAPGSRVSPAWICAVLSAAGPGLSEICLPISDASDASAHRHTQTHRLCLRRFCPGVALSQSSFTVVLSMCFPSEVLGICWLQYIASDAVGRDPVDEHTLLGRMMGLSLLTPLPCCKTSLCT